MCGIAGSIGHVDEAQLRLMTQMLYHRGPDDGAAWIAPSRSAGLGHRRLAVIDPSKEAAQPMQTDDGRFTLVFNGEIFNYRELRQILLSRGTCFRTDSDSEVLLHACATWGESVVYKLTGQFAFALWDEQERRLFAARDHLGIKPLVYAERSDRLLFASEAKALLAADSTLREADWSLLPQYLAFLWVPGERSMFRGITRLLPGHWLRWSGGKVETGSWWDPVQRWMHAVPHPGTSEERRDDFLELFGLAVQSQLVSDVPLGLLLSGGLDSTAILAAMTSAGNSPHAFTASYSRESRGADVFEDDRDYARLAATHFSANLEERELETDVPALLPEAVYHCDDPLADPTTVTNLALTRAAKESLTVLLSGMGADEILAGYPRYPAALLGMRFPFSVTAGWSFAGAFARMAQEAGMLPMRRARRLRTLADGLACRFPQSYLRFSTYCDEQRQRALLDPALSAELDTARIYGAHEELLRRSEALSPLQRMLVTDLRTFLPYLNLENMDKTSMANAVEIRVPFLDHRLVEFLMTLPDADKLRGRASKVILRDGMRGRLPDAILGRSKTGYSPPVRGWMRNTHAAYVEDVLLSSTATQRGLFRPGTVKHLLRENAAGRRDNSMQLWQLLVLETWQRVFLDAPLPAPAEDPGVLRMHGNEAG